MLQNETPYCVWLTAWEEGQRHVGKQLCHPLSEDVQDTLFKIMNRNCYYVEEKKVKCVLMKIATNEIIAIQVNLITIDKNHMYRYYHQQLLLLLKLMKANYCSPFLPTHLLPKEIDVIHVHVRLRIFSHTTLMNFIHVTQKIISCHFPFFL